MRLLLLLPVVVVTALTGCAHEETTVLTAADVSAVPPQEPKPTPEPEVAPPASRPRLSKTITLGEDSYVPPAPAAAAGQAQQQSVVVNNNIVVGGGGYGGYGGYGVYGGYPSSYGSRGRSSTQRSTTGGTSWGTSGWEGARRTAAPGQTPGVGGNWSAAPSYGPATMK